MDYVTEKFQLHRRESNPRPATARAQHSLLQHVCNGHAPASLTSHWNASDESEISGRLEAPRCVVLAHLLLRDILVGLLRNLSN